MGSSDGVEWGASPLPEGRSQLPWYLSEKPPDVVMRSCESENLLAVETGRCVLLECSAL